jgi:hypothetical protein
MSLQITAAAAPGDPENKTKYWVFEKVQPVHQ